jgi:nicotinamide riboside transporter PnuC
MDLFLQIWGGSFYLTNKILLAIAEGKHKKSKRYLKLVGWWIYILGVPAWVIILVSKQNWIAASIEAGGVPSMLLGLYSVYHKSEVTPRRLGLLAKAVTYAAIILGVGYSIKAHGGINSTTQLLEIGVMVGFLLGSYFLALNSLTGWLFFVLMNGSMAILMFMQGKPLLSIQQLCSLCFALYGFVLAIKTRKMQTSQHL